MKNGEKIEAVRKEMVQIVRRMELLTKQKQDLEEDLQAKMNERIRIWKSEK